MAETVITTNTDLLAYDYASRADVNRLAPHGDQSAWWVERHTSGYRMVLDDLFVHYGIEESDLTTTTVLKRAAAAAAMGSALRLGGRGKDPESDDGLAAIDMDRKYAHQMKILAPDIDGTERVPRYGRRQTVAG